MSSHHPRPVDALSLSAVALHLSLLGPPQITQGEHPLVIARLQVRLLLYRLASLAPVPRDELAFLFWPDVPDATARRNLTQLLSHLRRALPDRDLLLVTRNQVQLDDERIWSDVAVFQALVTDEQTVTLPALRQAAELYRGSLLEGVSAPEHAEWESWLTGERQALEHRYLAALTPLVHDATARGAYEEGIELARRYLAVDELAEEMHRQLIELHVANGDRSAALQQYEQCVAILEHELGVDPLPETRAAYEAALLEHPTNLPVPPTVLVGREKEVAHVVALLRQAETWLVTLTGPGGTGKTRLGLEVASRLLSAFAHGVFFVPLAPLRDPTLVLSAIAQALGVQEVGGKSLLEHVKRYLRQKQLLLVLDNFEHVLEAAPLLAELHAGAPRLTILVTSRERLRLRGENLFPVPPLGLPDEAASPAEVAEVEAVRLFVQQARQAQFGFALTDDTAGAVAAICRRLDGLPLAIELAAAHARVLPPQALLQRLAQPLTVLTRGPKDLPTRQQTLRATIAWSYELLDDAQQHLFRRLAVFAGGCTLESAQAVCDAAGDLGVDVLDGLASLVDKSLLRHSVAQDAAQEPRYEMLETIREFALERLEARGETEVVQRAHLQYFMELAERAEPELRGPEQVAWLDRLEREYNNLRAVMQFLLENEHTELACRLGVALWRYWHVRNHYSEAYRYLSEALSQAHTGVQPVVRAQALYGAARLAYDRAKRFTLLQESLSLFRQMDDRRGTAIVLTLLGLTRVSQEGAAALKMARSDIEEGLAIMQDLSDTRGMAEALYDLGRFEFTYEQDYDTAAVHLEKSARLFLEAQDEVGAALPLLILGHSELAAERGTAAQDAYERSLAVSTKFGNKALAALALEHIAYSRAWYEEDYSRAHALLEEAMRLAAELDVQNPEQHYMSSILSGIGHIFRLEGDYDRARWYLAEAMKKCDFEDQSIIKNSLWELGIMAVAQGHNWRGICFLGAAAALPHLAGVDIDLPFLRSEREQVIATTRSKLGETQFYMAWSEGQAMPLDEAIAYAQEGLAEPDEA